MLIVITLVCVIVISPLKLGVDSRRIVEFILRLFLRELNQWAT